MFDIGWQELFIVAVIGIVVIGPKELPRTLKAVTGALRKVRAMASEFQNGIDEVVREADLDDIKNSVTGGRNFDFENEIKETLDPMGDLEKDIAESLDDDYGETEGWNDDNELYDYEGDDSDILPADASNNAALVNENNSVPLSEELNKPVATADDNFKPAKTDV
jgi:Tat protein translocase TatB subunit